MGVGACELRHGGRAAVCAAHKDEENDQQDHAHDDIRQRRAVPRRSRRGKIIVGGQHAAGVLFGDQLVEILVEKLRVADAGRDALFCAVFAACCVVLTVFSAVFTVCFVVFTVRCAVLTVPFVAILAVFALCLTVRCEACRTLRELWRTRSRPCRVAVLSE